MKYVAIFGYEEKTDVAMACLISEKPSMEVISYIKKPISELIQLIVQNQFKPINFGIDRHKNLVQDCGVFSRFTKEGVLVILAEFINEKKEVTGYRVISSANGAVYNMTMDAIKQLYIKRKTALAKEDFVFIQNAIVRQYATDITISCYPLKSFEQIEIKQSKQVNVAKEAETVATRVEEKKVKPTADVTPPSKVQFKATQQKELEACEKAGIDTSLVSNPDLSAEQMHILWLCKSKKGALAEYFNDPAFSTDAMKFYADVLYSEEQADKYKDLLAHPELEVTQLQELINCIEAGIDYKDLIGLDAEQVFCSRVERDPKFWSLAEFNAKAPSSTWKNGELFDLMMKETNRIHSKGM